MAKTSDEEHAAAVIAELRPYAVKVVVEEYNPAWPHWYSTESAAIRGVLGSAVRRVEHTGSTSVPGLAAKPVIDIVLVLADTSDETGYVPALEAIGYTLHAREPAWYEHRCLIRRVHDGAPYDVNLHVFPAELAAPEIEKMLAFRDWLRSNDEDRARYEQIKRELARRDWRYVKDYANAKSDIVEEILTRALPR